MNGSFRDRLHRGDVLVGTWIKTPSPMVCEVLSQTELDLLCLDAEHAPFDRAAIDGCLLATRAAGMPTLVRIPSSAPGQILNALDCGATGVVVPHVVSADMARDVVKASHYGAGGRGYAGSSRAAAYTRKPMAEHLGDSAAQTTVVAQIEDLEALDAIDGIAAVDGIDCLFVGRIDLTVAMGASSPGDERVVAAVERICEAGKHAGRSVGMFVGNIDEVPRWIEAGANLFLLSSDHGFMQQGASALVQRVKGS